MATRGWSEIEGDEMITVTHYCTINERRICVDLRDVLLHLHKAKDANASIKYLIDTYEDLAKQAKVKLETSNQTTKIQ